MGNSSTAGRSSARGKANRYQRTQPPPKQHHPRRQKPSQSQRSNQFEQSSPSKVSPNLTKRHRRLPTHQQQQTQHGSDIEPPPAKRRRINSSASDSKPRQYKVAEASPVKPPVKISVSQPHGQLQRTTNGVRATLQISHDDLGSDRDVAMFPNDDKRVLRSQGGGPRSTSDLVQFFPDYEEYVFSDLNKRDVLNISSSLYVTDDKKQPQELPIRTASHLPPENDQVRPQSRDQPPSARLDTNSAAIETDDTPDLSAFDKEALEFKKDPLPDSEYVKAHKRGERNEKQMRNVEKERAMYEKSELERLYDELRGADWLKAMGISGITETEKKQYEPKRDHYIGKVKSLLTKFEKWKDKEKEMRVKREKAMVDRAESEDENEGTNDLRDQLKIKEEKETTPAIHEEQPREKRKPITTRKAPTASSSGVPADIKAKPASKQTKKQEPTGGRATAYDPTLDQWQSEQQITSFYKKPHEREAALGKHRRGGRHITAFGHPLPPMAEEEFGLPENFLTADERRDYARKRRRDKRESLKPT